jgi:hypothetical protein
MKKIIFAALLSGATLIAAPAANAATPLTVTYAGTLFGTNNGPFGPAPVVFTGETTLEDAADGQFSFSSFTALFNNTTFTFANASAAFSSATQLNLFSGATQITAFQFTGNTNFAADGTQYSVNLLEGNAFEVAGIGTATIRGGVGAVSGVVAAVPEPGTWAMMFVGFGMMGAAMRYRRRSTTTVYA